MLRIALHYIALSVYCWLFDLFFCLEDGSNKFTGNVVELQPDCT
jgi:hypothetical protein